MSREPVYGESQAVMDAAMRGELRVKFVLTQQEKAEDVKDRIIKMDYAGWPTRDGAGELEC